MPAANLGDKADNPTLEGQGNIVSCLMAGQCISMSRQDGHAIISCQVSPQMTTIIFFIQVIEQSQTNDKRNPCSNINKNV